MKRLLFLIIIFLFCSNLYAICEFHINNTKNVFELKGKWDFFKGGGTVAANPELDISTWETISVPFKWYQEKTLRNYKGEIWIRCNLYLNEIPEELYLDLGFIKEIDEVYWNGERIGGTGDFKNRIPDFSERRIYTIPLHILKDKNVIAIRIYGRFWNAGLSDIPKLYFNSKILDTKYKFEMLALAFNLTYIFSSVFFIFYGIYTQEKKSNFYFALFSILLAFYHMIIWGMRYKFFSNYIISYIAELLFLFPLPFLFLSFLKEWLNIEKIKFYNFIKYFTLLLMISAIIGYFIPYIYQTSYLHIVTYINLINIVFVVIITIRLLFYYTRLKYEETRYLNYGLLLLVPFIFNDILVALDLIHTPRMFVFSYPIFLLAVAINLSEKALKLKKQSIIQADEIRLMEKQKLNVIYNISNEFQSIFDEIKQCVIIKKNFDSALIRLNYLIESAQLLHQIENKKYVLQPLKVNLSEETLKIIDEVLKATKQKKNRLEIHIPDSQTTFWIDLLLYKIILYHLLENALLYSLDEVELTITIEENILKLRVYDKGPGIPVEIQNKIFNKYIRGNNKIPGSGIGLTLVKESVSLLSGNIHFESKQDFYTVFEITIPELKEII
ncbi:MAG: hypothetical protein KatS3mg129_0674 [Leptospiraceae bacterium]|nr:MAG: hypothetical protein KatS3mg129_0674 [Leptospiraceae bacterium]